MIFVFVPSTACGNDEAEIKKVLQSRYGQFDIAYKERDREKVEGLFDPGCKFKQTDEGRTLTLPRFMQGIEFAFRAMTVYDIKTRVETVKLENDDTAVVTVHSSSDVKIAQPAVEGVNNEDHRAKSNQIYRDTWKNTPQGWRIIERVID